MPERAADPAQLALDLEEANARLDRLRRRIMDRDHCRAEVARLRAELRRAVASLKFADARLAESLSLERRKILDTISRSPPTES
jgi:hypothetical protein